MDNTSKGNKENKLNVEKPKAHSKHSEEYEYDFVPNLNQWQTIDDQMKTVRKLEKIDEE